jgi:hypothetical protein
MTEFVKNKVADILAKFLMDHGKTIGVKLADEMCKVFALKIPVMAELIANGTLKQLNEKIDSEKFTTKFVNVLQQKLVDGKPPNDPFLNRFVTLFDDITKNAINNHTKPIDMTPENIVQGIANYLQEKDNTFMDSNRGTEYTVATEAALKKFKDQKDKTTPTFIDVLKPAVVNNTIMTAAMFEMALANTIKQSKPESTSPTAPDQPVAADAMPTNVPVVPATPFDATKIDGQIPVTAAEPIKQDGGRRKRTRKVSRKSKSRKNRRNRPKALTKRNLFL